MFEALHHHSRRARRSSTASDATASSVDDHDEYAEHHTAAAAMSSSASSFDHSSRRQSIACASKRSCEGLTADRTRELWRCMLELQERYGCYHCTRIDLALEAGDDGIEFMRKSSEHYFVRYESKGKLTKKK